MNNPITNPVRQEFVERMCQELEHAYQKHGRAQWSRHEFYGILKEEVDELWDAIKQDETQLSVMQEAMQIAAVVLRYYETGDRDREPNLTK